MRKYNTKKSKYAARIQPVNLSKIRHSQGFTLIEALVTVIVMSIGLLGVAALQNTSIKLTYDSYLRSQSSLLAAGLFDRMRANPSADYSALDYTSSNVGQTCVETTDNCDATQIATYDAAIWVGQVQEVFGSDTGVITIDVDTLNTDAIDFTITFVWSSRVNDADNSNNTSGNNDTQQFTYTSRIKNVPFI